MEIANYKIKKIIDFFKIFLPIWLFYSVILYLIRPGYFTVDENMLMEEIESGRFGYWVFWYHFLTGALYKIIYGIFHSRLAVAFFLVTTISGAVAFIYLKMQEIYKDWKLWISFALFFTPPAVSAVLCPARISIYSFFIWFFMAITYIKFMEKKEISYKASVVAGILTSILALYRGEGFIFIFVVPVFLYILFGKYASIKKIAVYLLTFILFFYAIISVQSKGPANAKYRMIPFSFEFERMMREYPRLNITPEEIKYIENYVNIQDIKDLNYSADFQAEKLFADRDFVKFYLYLCLKNYKEFFNSRYLLFINSRVWHGYMPGELTGTDLRKKIICTLQSQNAACSEYKFSFISCFNFLYDLRFTLLFVILIFLYALISRNKFYIFLSCWQIPYFALLFLTAPVAYFDYYLPIFLCSLFFIPLIFVKNLNKQ